MAAATGEFLRAAMCSNAAHRLLRKLLLFKDQPFIDVANSILSVASNAVVAEMLGLRISPTGVIPAHTQYTHWLLTVQVLAQSY